MNCPHCQQPVATRHGLAKHLAGTTKYGGHAMPVPDAADLAAAVAAGVVPPKASQAADLTEALQSLHALSDGAAADFLRLLLLTLATDKKLPKYQFERRIDVFLTPSCRASSRTPSAAEPRRPSSPSFR